MRYAVLFALLVVPALAGDEESALVRALRHPRQEERHGAAVILARDSYDGGFEPGLLAAQVMRGADLAAIPFEVVRKVNFIIDLTRARASGLGIPETVLQRATRVIEQ